MTVDLEAFDSEARALAAAIGQLTNEDLERPTRCGSWNVHMAVAHIIKALERAEAMVAHPVDDDVVNANPLVYYQSPQRSDPQRDAKRQAAVAETAARFADARQLADAIETSTNLVAKSAQLLGLQVSVQTHWGPVMRLGDYLRTRVVELAVHGIDIADAIGADTWTTASGARDVASLIEQLIGAGVPTSLGWSDLDLIRVGTGRRVLKESERTALGPLTRQFPVIS